VSDTSSADAIQIDIVCASDDAYSMPLAATLASAAHWLAPGSRLRIIVLDAGIGATNRAKLEESLARDNVDLELVPVGETVLRRYTSVHHFNWVTLVRLLVPDLFPRLDKVIFLDCDLVVCEDLTRLWLTPMDGKDILAVQRHTFASKIRWAGELGIAPETPYFQAGVMVLDLAALRSKELTRRSLALLETETQRLSLLDQDVLNLLCSKDWAPLDPRWNFLVIGQSGMAGIAAARGRAHPYIVHYAGATKPWHLDYGLGRPYSSYFYAALDLTAWKGWLPAVPPRYFARAHFPKLFRLAQLLYHELRRRRGRAP
jgi:lipopolysaccharide biosynthesis glycosyltransferase